MERGLSVRTSADALGGPRPPGYCADPSLLGSTGLPVTTQAHNSPILSSSLPVSYTDCSLSQSECRLSVKERDTNP